MYSNLRESWRDTTPTCVNILWSASPHCHPFERLSAYVVVSSWCCTVVSCSRTIFRYSHYLRVVPCGMPSPTTHRVRIFHVRFIIHRQVSRFASTLQYDVIIWAPTPSITYVIRTESPTSRFPVFIRPVCDVFHQHRIIGSVLVVRRRTLAVVSNIKRPVPASDQVRVAQLPIHAVAYVGVLVPGSGEILVDWRPGGSDVIVGVVMRRRVVSTVRVAARLVVVEVAQCVSVHRSSVMSDSDERQRWLAALTTALDAAASDTAADAAVRTIHHCWLMATTSVTWLHRQPISDQRLTPIHHGRRCLHCVSKSSPFYFCDYFVRC